MIKRTVLALGLSLMSLVVPAFSSPSGNIESSSETTTYSEIQEGEGSENSSIGGPFLYSTLPSSFHLDGRLYVSDDSLDGKSLDLDTLIGYMVHEDYSGEIEEDLFYVYADFEISTGQDRLPLYSVKERPICESLVVHTEVIDSVYTEIGRLVDRLQ